MSRNITNYYNTDFTYDGYIGFSQGKVKLGDSTTGQTNQDSNSIAIGTNSGSNYQSANSISIGNSAAQYSQGTNSVAIGNNAAQNSQGSNSVAIGEIGRAHV